MVIQLLTETELTKSESQWNMKHLKSERFIFKPTEASWCVVLSGINKIGVDSWVGTMKWGCASSVQIWLNLDHLFSILFRARFLSLFLAWEQSSVKSHNGTKQEGPQLPTNWMNFAWRLRVRIIKTRETADHFKWPCHRAGCGLTRGPVTLSSGVRQKVYRLSWLLCFSVGRRVLSGVWPLFSDSHWTHTLPPPSGSSRKSSSIVNNV